MTEVQQWVREYRDRGFAVCRVRPGEKRPTYKGWNLSSLEPEDFGKDDNVGLQAGTLSGNLVCVDLDHADVLRLADRFLPETGMVEGRPGKPKSHRWFVVKDIPPEWTAPSHVADGMGGPRTKRFKRPDKSTLVEQLGTGLQAVVPASVWVSKDGTRAEQREWQRFGDPAVVDCAELYEATSRLAAAAGWVVKERPRRARERMSRQAPERLPIPPGEMAQGARAHLARLDPAVEGQGGDSQTFFAACLLVIDYDLSPEEALALLLEYNERCVPPWTEAELWHKLAVADALDRPDRGWRIGIRSHCIRIDLSPGGPVYVGVDCAGPGRSYIDLHPSLYGGLVKTGDRRQLAPQLADVAWEGRQVILTPPSTIRTNKREVWGEFFLADLLRREGADVKSLHLPSLQGRRRTLSMADGLGELVDPSLYPWEADAAAEKASENARRLDAYRRSLPRKKASPKLDKALAFVEEYGVQRLTKDVLKQAKKRGLNKATLRRALLLKEEEYKRLPLSSLL